MLIIEFTVVPNDGFRKPLELLRGTTPDNVDTFPISSSASVKVALVTGDHTQLLAGPVDVAQSVSGSDWDNSLVIPVFSALDLAGLIKNYNDVALEIQVQEDGEDPQTWFFENGQVRVGFIS
jgi:hypothetical protein